jgi:hypothetical protein
VLDNAVRAVTLFRIRDGVTEKQLEEVFVQLERMWRAIPEVRSWQIGTNALDEQSSGGFTHAVMLEFRNESDWMSYRQNPLHLDVARKYLVPLYAGRAAAALVGRPSTRGT